MPGRKAIGALILALAGVGSAWWIGAQLVGDAATANALASRAAAGGGAASRPLACRFERGDQAAFRIAASAEAPGNANAGGADQFNAVLSWEVIEESAPGEWLMRAALSSVGVRQWLSQPAQRLTQPLEGSFLLRIGRDCRFAAKGYARTWLPVTRRFVSSVIGSLEFAVAPAGAGLQWEAEQADGMGRYAATYGAVTSASGETELSKRKTGYRDVAGAVGLGFQIQLVQSSASAVLDREGRWLRRASGVEHVKLKAQGALLADLEQRFDMVRDDAPFLRPDSSVALAAFDWQDPFQMPDPAIERIDPAIARLTRGEALARFAEIYRSRAKGDAYASALFLAEWLKAHPDEARHLLDQARSGALAEAMRPAAFLALERAGTPQARAVLSQALADASLGEMDRARAASALSDIAEPTRESALALAQAARDSGSSMVSGSSIRALGHLEERSATVGPELQGEIRNVLRAELSAATSRSRTVDVIDAIGNTGDAAFAAELNGRLLDASPAVREHAARAFRRMQADVAAAGLVERLQAETDPGVRSALAQSLLAMNVTDAGAMTQAAAQLAAEPSPTVRASLIQWLGSAASQPAARQALAAQFRREKVPQLMQLIGRYVSADDLK